MHALQGAGQRRQFVERGADQRPRGQALARLGEHLDPAVQIEQRMQRGAALARHAGTGLVERGGVLGDQRIDDRTDLLGVQRRASQAGAHDARIAEVDQRCADAGRSQAVEGELDDLEVGLEPGVAVDLGAELQRFARSLHAGRAGVQHRAAVAQAGDTLAVEQVRIDARDLRRRVGTHTQHAPAGLVDQLEGAQVERVAGARQQRLQVLDQRRHDQLEAVAAGEVEQRTAQILDPPGLRRQHIGDVLGQQPGRRHRVVQAMQIANCTARRRAADLAFSQGTAARSPARSACWSGR